MRSDMKKIPRKSKCSTPIFFSKHTILLGAILRGPVRPVFEGRFCRLLFRIPLARRAGVSRRHGRTTWSGAISPRSRACIHTWNDEVRLCFVCRRHIEGFYRKGIAHKLLSTAPDSARCGGIRRDATAQALGRLRSDREIYEIRRGQPHRAHGKCLFRLPHASHLQRKVLLPRLSLGMEQPRRSLGRTMCSLADRQCPSLRSSFPYQTGSMSQCPRRSIVFDTTPDA